MPAQKVFDVTPMYVVPTLTGENQHSLFHLGDTSSFIVIYLLEVGLTPITVDTATLSLIVNLANHQRTSTVPCQYMAM